jgi:transposase/IS5 family transposase
LAFYTLVCVMTRSYRRYEPDQALLLPPSLREWLQEDHLAFFISDAMDGMELSAFDARYADDGPGNQAFDPRMMLKVLVYAYATGTFSSRKIAAKLHEDVAYRVLGADNFPAHRTLSDFRQRHLPEFRDLFVQRVQMAQEVGLVKLGTVAVDGSKIKANASRHKAMSYGRMKEEEKRLRKEIKELMAKAKRTDAQEDKRYGKDARGDELPAELARREDRLRTIEAARQRLEARQREADEEKGREPGDQDRTGKPGKPFKRAFGEPEPSQQENFTDPDSRIMKQGSSGFDQCYNAQIAVDEAEQIIVATGLTQNASDVHQLEPLLEQLQETTGQYPDKTLADAGYRSESNLQMLEEKGIDGFVAMGREKNGESKEPAPENEATCRMSKKMKTDRAKKHYRKRKYLGEPPFAWIKSVMGFDRFSLRGVEKVTSEWNLACLAANLKRMRGKVEWA